MTSVVDLPAAASEGPADGAATSSPGGPPGGDPPAHPVTRFLNSMSRALDQLAEAPTWSMSAAEQGDALVRLRAQRARLAELEMRVLLSADRNDVGKAEGATSTPAWLAHATGSTRAECF